MKALAMAPTLPMWLALMLMFAGCAGLVVSAFAWLFASGPLPTSWFLALSTLCAVLVAVSTTTSLLGWTFWFIMIVGFNAAIYSSYVRASK